MKPQTRAMAADVNAQYERYRRPTKRDTFLATMERIVPWAALCEVIEPHYPKAGNGRPPVGLERMLRMYFVQHWFNLADAACDDALLDSTALRRFVGIDLGRERVPDATTLLKFRRLLETHKLGEALFAKVGQVLQAHGLKVNTASIAAFDGQAGQVAYSASKAGVAGMMLAAARGLARHGIRVVAIAPGLFVTPMVAGLSDEARASSERMVPFPSRTGRPEEYASLVCRVLENLMINGEAIRIDGGLRMPA